MSDETGQPTAQNMHAWLTLAAELDKRFRNGELGKLPSYLRGDGKLACLTACCIELVRRLGEEMPPPFPEGPMGVLNIWPSHPYMAPKKKAKK